MKGDILEIIVSVGDKELRMGAMMPDDTPLDAVFGCIKGAVAATLGTPLETEDEAEERQVIAGDFLKRLRCAIGEISQDDWRVNDEHVATPAPESDA